MNDYEPIHEVRDPLYGFVKLSKAEWAIVNHPAFQRLRDIRQLAMGHMVYPGANHTRFEHSLGCLHLASTMFDALVERESEKLSTEYRLTDDVLTHARQVLRLGALLHDVGHAPFSHTGEGLLPPSKTADGEIVLMPDGKPRRMKHEDMSAKIIRERLGKLIESEFETRSITADEIIAVAVEPTAAPEFKARAYHSFLNELLAGELGADRIDYLLRDAHHSGQRAGDFDYRRLVGCVRLVAPPEEDASPFSIGFDEGGWLVAEQMIAARYFMYMALYFHKTKRICEIHLTSFVHKWLAEQGADSLPLETDKYVALSDSDIWSALKHAAAKSDDGGHDHARRLINRTHLRLAKEIILADNHSLDRDGRRIPDKNRLQNLNNSVRYRFGSGVEFDQPDHGATKMFGDNKILVALDGKTRYLDDISEVVRGMPDKIWRGRIYAEPGQRVEVRNFCDQWLSDNPPSSAQGGNDGKHD